MKDWIEHNLFCFDPGTHAASVAVSQLVPINALHTTNRCFTHPLHSSVDLRNCTG